MKRLAFAAVGLAVCTLFALPAQAETVQHQPAGIQFDLPEGWTYAPEGDHKIRVKNKDESVEVVLAVSEKDSVEAVAADVAGEVDDYLKDVKIDGDGKGETGEHNGMPMWSISGTGTWHDQPWAWDITIIMVKKPVVVLSWATPDILKTPPADVVAFFKSVRKID